MAGTQDEIFGDNFDGFDLTPCDSGLLVDSADTAKFAAALDLCQTTTEGGSGPGLISASFTLADGTGTPNSVSRAMRPSYGTNIVPQRGSRLVLLSTGTAAGSSDTGYVAPQVGFNAGTQSALPADWVTVNPPACAAPFGATARDPVMLKLRIRVPNNAQSFSLDANFLSADFPEGVCGQFVDHFVALLDSSYSGSLANPSNKNLAIVTTASLSVPLDVNLAMTNTALFRQCLNGIIGCDSPASGVITTCIGNSELAGTGMDVSNAVCGYSAQVGGGTGWVVIRGNVVRGEIIELRLAIWDTGDESYDSDVVLDNFRWSYNPATPGATAK